MKRIRPHWSDLRKMSCVSVIAPQTMTAMHQPATNTRRCYEPRLQFGKGPRCQFGHQHLRCEFDKAPRCQFGHQPLRDYVCSKCPCVASGRLLSAYPTTAGSRLLSFSPWRQQKNPNRRVSKLTATISSTTFIPRVGICSGEKKAFGDLQTPP